LVSPADLVKYKDGIFDIIKKQFSKFNFSKYFSGQTPENLIFGNFPLGI